MFLSQGLAQKCVDRVMKNLGHNINIMNNQGIIIASGSKERIGTYHKVAEEVVKRKKRIDVYSEDVEKYEGVREGINMPFFYKNYILGVIGITGDPSSLRKTAKIVKMVIELMIEQELLKGENHINKDQTILLINKIFEAQNDEDAYDLVQLAHKLGYELELPRVACLLSFKDMDDLGLTINAKAHNKVRENSLIKEIVLLANTNNQDIVCNLDGTRILIFKTIKDINIDNIKKYIFDYYMELKDMIKSKLDKEIYFTTGSLHEGVLGIKESYDEAMFLLDYCMKCDINNQMAFIEDYIIEYLCMKLPRKYLEHFLLRYVEKIKDKHELIETIESLIKNNMNLKRAATALYVHRNTIIFRVNKIKELLDIDPINNDKDRILLRLLYYYIKAKNNYFVKKIE